MPSDFRNMELKKIPPTVPDAFSKPAMTDEHKDHELDPSIL